MKKTYILIPLFVLSLMSCRPPSTGYHENSPRGSGKRTSLPPVQFRPFPVAYSNGQIQIYLLSEITYDMMQFTLQNGRYTSNFQIEIAVREENSKETYSKTWQATKTLSRFEETNRPDKFFLTVDSILIPPGNYQLSYKYQDLQGKQTFSLSQKYQFLLSEKLSVQAPLYLEISDSVAQLDRIPYRPLANFGQLPFNKKLGLFLNAYSPDDSLIQMHLEITDDKESLALFSLDTLLKVRDHRAQLVTIPPFLAWEEGKYQIKLFIKTTTDSLEQKNSFTLNWNSKPKSLREFDYAIQPLKVILPEAQHKSITSGDKDKKLINFHKFWEQKDPTPETAFNEILNEFYRRVDSVDYVFGGKNRLFGWHSEPGRILLINGPPDEVEDQSLRPLKPYLKWIYYTPDGQRVFTFRAINGRNRYRLINDEEIINQ